MRVNAAFNRMLAIVGASVASVTFTPEGVIVGVRVRRRKHRCPCGWATWSVYDRSVRRWRHLDLGSARCFLEAEICRIACARCARVRTEEVPWAGPGARHSRDFQAVVAWLAQRTDKTTICRLLRVSWEAVSRIVMAVVEGTVDDARLGELYRIGVDEVSYRKGQRFLTVIADHDREGRVVWAADGRNHGVLERFYDDLGPEGRARLRAVSRDMGPAYRSATDARVGHVRQCIDPFHVVKLANEALNKVRRSEWQAARPWRGLVDGRYRTSRYGSARDAKQLKNTRWLLLKDPAGLTSDELEVLHGLRRHRLVVYRAWQLKEGLRDLYRLRRRSDAPRHLDWWLAWACRSRIPAMVRLSRTVRANRDEILAAVELGLSNSKLEGLASKVRLINHRGYGHHSAAALIAMIYLCCGGITIQLPTER